MMKFLLLVRVANKTVGMQTKLVILKTSLYHATAWLGLQPIVNEIFSPSRLLHKNPLCFVMMTQKLALIIRYP